jgi:cobalamin biosynthesis protein CbiD
MVRGDKLANYFDSEKLGVAKWHKDIHDASLEDTIIGVSEVVDLLGNEEYRNQFRNISQNAAKTLKDSTAKALEHIDESSGRITLDHYKTKIHQSKNAVKTFEESFIQTQAKHLENFGHTGFSKIDASTLDDDHRKRMVMTLASLVEQYHGKVEDMGITDILNETVYNKNNQDAEFADIYQLTDKYFDSTHENIASRIAQTALQRANSKHQTFEDYEAKVSTFKETAQKLGLPLKDDVPDSVYGLANIGELFTLHSLNKKDKLTPDSIKDSAFANHIKDMYSTDNS